MNTTESNSLPSYEQSLQELDQILKQLEDGTTTLEESLARYERGIALIQNCYGKLQAAELRVKKLAGLSEQGEAQFEPFEHVATPEKQNLLRRSNAKKEQSE